MTRTRHAWLFTLLVSAAIYLTLLACSFSVANVNIAFGPPSPTPTFTRTPRPSSTPLPTETSTATPTNTATPLPTGTATRRPPTLIPRPPTPRPATAIPGPAVSTMEFHVNPPSCSHSGQTYIKGTVYLNKNDPSQRYAGAIVDLGAPDGSMPPYATIMTDGNGEYTFVLGDPGQAHPGSWGVWLVDPSQRRKSDIGGPINTNNLPADNPASCWAGGVDFWK